MNKLLLVALAVLSSLWINAPTHAADNIAAYTELDAAADWPWWRGPNRNGIARGSQFPTRFGDGENILWKVPVPGRGHSSPIVVAGKVFLTTADESRQTQSVLAYDLATGNRLWASPVSQGGFPAKNHPKNTEATPTLASDGESLFATFFHHQQVQLTALTLDGKLVWRKTVAPFNPRKYEYGYAASPLLVGDKVVVATEYDGDSFLTAFDRRQGNELWRVPRPNNITFSSPVLADLAGQEQLLISGSGQVCSYDPKNGQLLWSVPGTTSATCGTIVWSGELVIASGGYPKAETIAVVADGSGTVAWKNSQKCYEQSMIEVDGYVYALTDNGVLYCWRAADGNEMWRTRLKGPVSSSPVLAGGNIYWANESGTHYVFRPNPNRFELIAENRLGTEAFASPAVSGNRILFRVAEGKPPGRQEYLICIGFGT